ncbi:MAG: lamin tail domain-containing protein [Candidatus Nomurabacteria bacterium]|nr:lamin tail domain-containing protein [Candidatus Nomurabacteria bacterium]
MSKKILLVLVYIITFFSFSHFASADIKINEIMYAPVNGSNYEWIEIYNSGSDPVDLTKYRFCKDSACQSSSPFSLKQGSDSILLSNSYAIIAKSISSGYDWLNFSGKIFSASVLSLPDDSSSYNTYVGISDPNKVILDSVTYDTSLGGSKDSNTSLSKINGSWIPGNITPGLENVAHVADNNGNNSGDGNGNTNDTGSSGDNTSGSGSGSSTSSHTSSGSSTKEEKIQTIKTKVTTKNNGFINIPINFKAETFGFIGSISKQLYDGRYLWNFGDGDSREVEVTNNEKFTHTYYYPGEYTVILEHYPNHFTDTPDANDKVIIKISSTVVYISNTGDINDFFVELTNSSDFEADISGWSLSSNNKYFHFPKNTIIPSGKKLLVSSKITGLDFIDKDNLKLLSPTNETVFDYGNSIKYIPTVYIPKISNTSNTEQPLNDVQNNTNQESNADLSAGVVNSVNSNNYNLTGIIFWSILISFAVLSVWFLRRRSFSSGAKSLGNDFEVLDE